MMTERYPGYDVLAKRDGLSWNDPTRKVIDERLAIKDEPAFFSHEEWLTMNALCERILPQPPEREKIPLAAYIDRKLLTHGDSGTKILPMPYDGSAWKTALAALNAESIKAHGKRFHELDDWACDALLRMMQAGELHHKAWGDIPSALFFAKRVLIDIPAAYYAHPVAWNEIGFGGPASPRGYVRMGEDRRDPWEAAEVKPGKYEQALRDNRRVR